LEDGRSIMMIRSTSDEDGTLRSNIRWSYGHTTIPRHLRDIVVTEYGVADLRGRSDEEVIAALVEIADSRFQEELLERAKHAGKLSKRYRLPDHARNNRPERLKNTLARYRERGLFPEFPFGTDLTEVEITLQKALHVLEETIKRRKLHIPKLAELRKIAVIPHRAQPYLERMVLDHPRSFKEQLLQRAVVYALTSQGGI
jgi:hypothetical protein